MAKKKIRVNFSDEDLQDLMAGKTFDWTFPTEDGEDIDVHLFQGEEEEDE